MNYWKLSYSKVEKRIISISGPLSKFYAIQSSTHCGIIINRGSIENKFIDTVTQIVVKAYDRHTALMNSKDIEIHYE